MNSTFFLALIGSVCAAGFLIGFRFWRMDKPLSGTPVKQVNQFGLVLMVANPFLFLFMTALVVSGAIGPIYGPEWLQ